MNQEEYQRMIDNEVKGAETAVQTMLLYYVSALRSIGVEDVKQYIATKMSDMISLADEQCNFVTNNFKQDGKLVDNLQNSIRLLEKMEETKELDLESVSIIKQILELILHDCKHIQ